MSILPSRLPARGRLAFLTILVVAACAAPSPTPSAVQPGPDPRRPVGPSVSVTAPPATASPIPVEHPAPQACDLVVRDAVETLVGQPLTVVAVRQRPTDGECLFQTADGRIALQLSAWVDGPAGSAAERYAAARAELAGATVLTGLGDEAAVAPTAALIRIDGILVELRIGEIDLGRDALVDLLEVVAAGLAG